MKRNFIVICFIIILALGCSGLVIGMEYVEPSSVSELVEEGELPQVEERLPENPKIVSGIEKGEYGGSIALGCEEAINNYNWLAGRGDLGTWFIETLIETKNPEREEYEPNLVEKWEFKDDAKEIHFTLRKGIKWSDGKELTTEDVDFSYNDCILDENIPHDREWAKVGGEYAELEVVDKYNFKFIFNEPYPVFLDLISRYTFFPILPKHNMSQFHPKYNEDMDYQDWSESRGTDHELVTLSAWIIQPGGSSNRITAKRNPYYWKVSEYGQQLPYIDEVIVRGDYESRLAYGLTVVSGDTDVIIDGFSADILPTLMQHQDDRPYNVVFPGQTEDAQPGQSYTGPMFNLDAPDPNLRKLFKQKEFMDALKYGVERERFKDALPYAVLMKGVYPPPTTPYYEKEVFEKHEFSFDMDKANQLLDELGLEDINGDGFRQYSKEYSDPGETIEFTILAGSGHKPRITAFELLAEQYRENLGIKAETKVISGSLLFERWPYGEWDVFGRWPVMGRMYDRILYEPRCFGKMGDTPEEVPEFHTKGAIDDPLEWEVEVGELLKKARTIIDFQERKKVIIKALDIFSENAPMDFLYMEPMFRAVPDEELIGNVPYYKWPEKYVGDHGSPGQMSLNISYWYWK